MVSRSVPRNDRNFILTFEARGGTVTVKPPLRVAFQADKSTSGGLNKIQIKLYNLAERNRLQLVRDAEEFNKVIPISLSVGYQDSLKLLFKGTVHTGSNQRQGPDIITTIEGLDGGIGGLESYTSRTVEGGKRAVDAAIADMLRITPGKINDRPPLTRPKVLVGNSLKLIDDMIGPDETWYIDNEQLYIINEGDAVTNFVPLVSAATGLINTPERENQKVTFQTLMNPSIRIGGNIKLQSVTAPHLNGIYYIETISYQGDNYGDEWSQTCTGRLSG